LGTFEKNKLVVAKVIEFGMIGRQCRSINDKGGIGVEKFGGDEFKVVPEMDICPFVDEAFGERRRCTVVSGDVFTLCEEVTYERTHTDSSCPEEIKVGVLIEVHVYK
jgi:hypothetical protein